MVVSSIPGRRTIGQLVLGRVTVIGGHATSVYVTSHPGQLSLLPSVGREINTGRMSAAGDQRRNSSFHSWISVWVAGQTVIFVNTCHSEHFKGKYTYEKALYNCPLLILDWTLHKCS